MIRGHYRDRETANRVINDLHSLGYEDSGINVLTGPDRDLIIEVEPARGDEEQLRRIMTSRQDAPEIPERGHRDPMDTEDFEEAVLAADDTGMLRNEAEMFKENIPTDSDFPEAR